MYIAVEAMFLAQVGCNLHKAFHCIVGISDDPGTEKQALDIVAAIEFHCNFNQFAYRKGGTRNVIGAPVDAVCAIIHAPVGQHHLQ